MQTSVNLFVLFSSLVLLSSCSPPNVILHPEFPIKPAYIVGRWILPFNDTDPPLYDTITHHFIGNPCYEVLDFKSDGTFTIEIHKKNKVSILKNVDMWWRLEKTNTYDDGPALTLKNMRFYSSELTGMQYYKPGDRIADYVPRNPEELILEIGNWFSKNPDDLYLCFEDGDVDLCFSRETPYKESTQLNAK